MTGDAPPLKEKHDCTGRRFMPQSYPGKDYLSVPKVSLQSCILRHGQDVRRRNSLSGSPSLLDSSLLKILGPGSPLSEAPPFSAGSVAGSLARHGEVRGGVSD